MKSKEELEQENFDLKMENKDLTNRLKEEVIRANKNKKLAEFDYLTQITNRMSFERACRDMIDEYQNKNYPFSLIYIDLDNFKSVNDNYSHTMGDMVLVEVANKLVVLNRAQAVVGRLGGEEFGILVPGLIDTEAVVIADRIKENFHNIEFKDTDIEVTASIGIYSPEKEDNVQDLIYKADKAMYYSKMNGKDQYNLYRDIPEDKR